MKTLVSALALTLALLVSVAQPVAAAPAPTPVVFVGDSLTELCNSSYTSFRPPALAQLAADGYVVDAVGSRSAGGCTPSDIEHEGKAGDTTEDVLTRLSGGLAGLTEAPEVAFVLLGTNDVQDSLTPTETTTNLEGIIAALRAENTNVHIVVGTIPPYPGKPTETAAVNAVIAGLAEGGASPVTIVDLHAQIDPGLHLAADDIHLTPAGADLVGLLVANAMVSTGALAEAAPTEPTSLAATGGENLIDVGWEPPAGDGGRVLVSYEVEVLGPDTETVTVDASVTEVSFDGLAAGTYTVVVRASNDLFTGPASAVENVVVVDPPAPPPPPAPSSPWAPFDDEQGFISQQYLDFLDRSPDAGGLAYWEGLTNDDQSNVAEIIEGFMASPEFSPRRSVARLYLAFFGRWPDTGGFDYWTESIASGTANLDTVSQAFVQSPEFVATYGSLSDAEFVDLVYTNVLGRGADQGGYDFWLAQMAQGMTRGQVMTRFSESPEYVANTTANVDVAVTYRGMLDREPDQAGYDFWVEQIAADPNSLLTLIGAFFDSAEYAGRVQTA